MNSEPTNPPRVSVYFLNGRKDHMVRTAYQKPHCQIDCPYISHLANIAKLIVGFLV